MQKEIWQKINKRFNTVNVEKEFCLLYGEVWEAFNAYNKNKDDLNEELADIAIYLIGLSEMSEFDLEDEIVKKMKTHQGRYKLRIFLIISSTVALVFGSCAIFFSIFCMA